MMGFAMGGFWMLLGIILVLPGILSFVNYLSQ